MPAQAANAFRTATVRERAQTTSKGGASDEMLSASALGQSGRVLAAPRAPSTGPFLGEVALVLFRHWSCQSAHSCIDVVRHGEQDGPPPLRDRSCRRR